MKLSNIIKLNLMNTSNMTLLRLSIFFLIGFSLMSCNKLSSEKAKNLILQKYNLPADNIRDILVSVDREITLTSTSKDPDDYTPPKFDDLLLLEQEGLIDYSIEKVSSTVLDSAWWKDGCGYSSPFDYFTGKDAGRILKYQVKVIYKHNGVLTEKGKKDYVGGSSFRVSTTTFGEITGIVRNKSMNIVEVKYTVFETPTPFGVTAFNMQERTIEKTEIFRKYDDGWRIE